MELEQINIQELFDFLNAQNTIILFVLVVVGKGVLSAIQYYKAGQFDWKTLIFGILGDLKYMVVAYTFYAMFVATSFEWFNYAFRIIGAYFIGIQSYRLFKSLNLEIDSEYEEYELDIENDENYQVEFNQSDAPKKDLLEIGVD